MHSLSGFIYEDTKKLNSYKYLSKFIDRKNTPSVSNAANKLIKKILNNDSAVISWHDSRYESPDDLHIGIDIRFVSDSSADKPLPPISYDVYPNGNIIVHIREGYLHTTDFWLLNDCNRVVYDISKALYKCRVR